MTNAQILNEYKRWMACADSDPDIQQELKNMAGSPDQIEDAFYQDLAFGTGGLRGVIGAGTNRMNIYTVGKATQGLANYIIKNYPAESRSAAISYDSRIKSDLFAKITAGVLAANGIRVWIWTQLMPTPCLSFATRELKCSVGVMITASHNPAKYNGYKVYRDDGCQITTAAAADIFSEIEKLDIFSDIRKISFEDGIRKGLIQYIPDHVYTSFIKAVKSQTMLTSDDHVDRNAAIVYSPLNGTGLKPVTTVLRESGFINITIVKEQEQPDGNFPTCPYPNPEVREAMELGIKYATKNDADLLLATDPDCDRIGIAVKNPNGEFQLLSGNETGMLLLDYICCRRQENGTMPADPVIVKTIVTTDVAERIAAHYGVRTINVLTGFKFIGEQIGLLEKMGKAESYIFGFEESYGVLSGTYVRDKDAVDGAFLICEMFAYYKAQGISLLEKLDELYRKYGYCLNTLHSYEFDGQAGFEKMNKIMDSYRQGITEIGGKKVRKCLDYSVGIDGLPKSNVLKYLLEDNCSVVIRPSGTEPKLKIYISISAVSKQQAKKFEAKVTEDLSRLLK